MRRRLAHLCSAGAFAVGLSATAIATSAERASSAATAAAPSVRITPLVVQRGDTITVTGRNWARNAIVDLLIGPPQSEAVPVGRARTTSSGTFRRQLRIARNTVPGRWVLLGCRRECRVKAVKSFRVTR